jgi:hypothetical protein
MTTHKTSTHPSPAQDWKRLTLTQIICLDGDWYVRAQIEKMVSPAAKTAGPPWRLWRAESLSAAQVAKIRHPAGRKLTVIYDSKANRIAAD